MEASLSPIQRAYLAGFLDGDGSIYARAKPNSAYRHGFQIALYIVLFQSAKSKDEFEEVCALIGCGKMRERNDGMMEYSIGKIADVRAFLECMRPFVILKKKQLELMLRIIGEKEKAGGSEDFAKLLALIDSYRALNYSKKRKIRVLTP